MANNDDKKENKKVFDVTKPGKSTPSASARPVIIGHKPMIQDPMVAVQKDPTPTAPPIPEKDQELSEAEDATEPKAKKTTAVVIEPPKDLTLENEDTTVEKDEQEPKPVDEPVEQETPAENKPSVEDEPKEEPDEETTNDTDEMNGVGAVADQVVKKKEQEELDQAEKAKQEAVEKLIQEKTYNLPIGEKRRKRRWTGLIIFLFLLLVLAATAYLLVDAGVIQTDITLPYDFIKD